jgi:hypothetical protein
MKFILEIAVASRNWFNVRKKSNWSDIFFDRQAKEYNISGFDVAK